MLPWNLVTAAVSLFLTTVSSQDVSISGRVSIIDVLSESAQFSILLRQLQRTGLVPVLNEATNSTFIAPTNAAFVDIDPFSISREQLLYHLLNKTIVLQDLATDLVVPTYLYSSSLDYSAASKKDEDYPLPIYLKNDNNKSFTVGNAAIVEQDLKASKGHGVVQVVDSLLEIPPSICEKLESNKHTSIFSKIFKMEVNCSMPMLPSYATLLVPLDSAFDQLNEIELNYLLSSSAKKDRQSLLARHMIDSFLATPLINASTNATALDGTILSFSDSMIVNNHFEPQDKDFITSDGVMHFYDKFIAGPKGDIHSLLEFTPEKYCIALGAHGFVKELEFRGLLHLVNGKTDHQTLFVPVDDQDDQSQIESDTSLLYHFVYGQQNLDFDHVLNSNILLESKSVHKKLGMGHQRMKVVADESTHSIYLNAKSKVVNGPYVTGNTTIFTINGPLTLPPSLDLAVGSLYHSSHSGTYLYDLGLLDLDTKHGWTVLLPSNAAWDKMDLVQKYLESNETALRGVFESLILADPIYSDSAPMDSRLLNGANVTVNIHHESHSIEKRHYANEPFDIVIDDTAFHVQTPNVLSSNGVVHSVSEVLIPKHVEVTPSNILDSVDASLFVNLLQQRNLSHVLEPGSGYTILAPSDHALQSGNVTVDTPDIDLLLRLHIIPGNPIKKFLSDGQDVESLAEGIHLTAKELNTGNFLVSIVEGDMREIRVLNRGDSSDSDGQFTTILYVDRFLSPDWITRITPPFKNPFRLKTPVAILLGMVSGVILIFSVIACVLFVFLKRSNNVVASRSASASNTPNGPRSPDLERRPLLSRKSSAHSNRGGVDDPILEGDSSDTINGYGSASRSRRSSMRSFTSENSTCDPIPTAKVQKDREHGRHLGLPRA